MTRIYKAVQIVNLENMPVMLERFMTYYRSQQHVRTHVKVFAFTWRNFELEAQNTEKKDQNFCVIHDYWVPGEIVMFVNVNLAEQFSKEMQKRLYLLAGEFK